MIKQFEHLTPEEQQLLLKAPVLVSVFASCSLNNVSEAQKADAIKLSHIKTFTADPLLLPYYATIEKTFREDFEDTARKYFPFDRQQRYELQNEINRVNRVISKLDIKFANTLRKSLDKYARHVRDAHSVFRDFVFPIPIPGLTS